METLRIGATGATVRYLQSLLSQTSFPELKIDGDFGPKTERAVEAFQEHENIYVDGVVGPVTWDHLHKARGITEDQGSPRLGVERVEGARKYNGEGYESIRLREDAAEALQRAQTDLHDCGGQLTSSGGLRSLSARVGSNRSATSLHYVGRAFDLFVYSAMVNPHKDPFVVTRDACEERKFVVWARCSDGAPMTLEGVTYDKAKKSTGYPQVIVPTEGRFINFTELVRQEGFERISCRRSFLRWDRKNNGGAEWWHFQYEEGLEEGITTFGNELLRLYTHTQLTGSAPWKYRHHVWGVNWR